MASQRPLIGINADLVPAGKQTTSQVRLNTNYLDTILAAGGLPCVIPPLATEQEVRGYLDRLDGFVLSGGADIDPRRQGLPSHPSIKPMALRRDDSDRLLVSLLVERRVPLLAIGVGLQQLTLATGGALHLHIPEAVPGAIPHHDPTGQPHRHLALIEPDTRLDAIYGCGEIRVNSTHHQAVRKPGPGFRVAARAPDGVIEAIEWTEPDWFCLGVQWHPEAESATALDLQLFESLVITCSRAPFLRLVA